MKYSVLAIILIPLSLASQIDIRPINTSISSISELWAMELTNSGGKSYEVRINLTVQDDGRMVYEGISNQFPLIEPVKLIQELLIGPIQTNLQSEMSSGDYVVSVEVQELKTSRILGRNNWRIQMINDSPKRDGKRSIGQNIRLSGSGFVSGQYATMQGVGSQIPEQFLRAELYPEVSIYDVPIGLDVFYSTEESVDRQAMTQVALRFDAQQFKNNMERRLRNKVKNIDVIGDPEELANMDKLKKKLIAKKFPHLAEWEEQLRDPDIQNGLKQLKQLESIESVLENKEIQKGLLRKAKLEAMDRLSIEQLEELESLQDFAQEIKNLETKVQELKTLTDKYEQYKDLNDKISKAKKYADKDLIKDPKFLTQGLKSLDIMSKGEEWLNGFEAITVGNSYPYYSRYTLRSLNVNGIHVEWNPGQIYLAAIYGQSARQAFNSEVQNPDITLGQTTTAAKLGYGAITGNHLHLSWIEIKDRMSSDSLNNLRPAQSNRMIGLDGQWSILQGNVTLGGEWTSSLFNRDRSLDQDQDVSSENSLSFALGELNSSSSLDQAWRAFGDFRLFKGNTVLSTNIERVGAQFVSLGAPALLNNLLRWRAELKQQFFKKQLSVSAFARQDDNNIDPLLVSSQSTIRSYGISGSLRLKKGPMITASFAPYAQRNEVLSTQEEFDSKATSTQVLISYPIQWGRQLQTSTQLTFQHQDMNSNIPEIDYDLTMYGISQSVNWNRSGITVNANYTPNQLVNDVTQEVITLHANANFELFRNWSNSFGWQYVSITNQENRNGFFYNSTYPITQWLTAEMRVQRNIYQQLTDANLDYQDMVAWMGIRVRW